MDIREITDQQALDAFVGSLGRSQFLQSWRWGEFNRQLPSRVVRLGIFDGDSLVGSAQIIEHALPLGKEYWYVPRGPVVNEQMPVAKFQTAYRDLIGEIVGRAEKENIMFIKLEPPLAVASRPVFDSLMKQYQVKPVRFVQPAETLYLDVRQSEEQLLQSMHPKTRYNIRLAEKKGVEVHTGGDVHDFDVFWRLMEVTARRDSFQQHSRSYYREMFRFLAQTDFMKTFLAEYRDQVIAANFVVFFGDTATYLHGASADESREIMAPHVLQWRQIQEAKKRGLRYYDFWGVAPARAGEEHPWAGLSRFKRGFGGFEADYLGAYDLILDPMWYRIYKIAQRARLR